MLDINICRVSVSLSIKDAVKKMDEAGIGFCVCVDDQGKVVGVMSDGDFRRAVLKGYSLEDCVERIINKEFCQVDSNFRPDEIEKIFSVSEIQHVPVIDDGNLIDIITQESFYGFQRENIRSQVDNPVVIMAGGKGKRMDPFTRVLPKPLLPIGDEPIIKVIMDQFNKFGMDNFYISLNDKGRMVKAYFHDLDSPYSIKFIEEEQPLGTAGALKYLEGEFNVPFFVSNCDIILRTDYSEILDFHVDGSYALTLIGSMRHYKIPYGVCDIGDGGELRGIREKPEYDFLVNTGVYLINPIVLKFLSENTHCDMPDLIEKVQANELKVGVFPVSEKSWSDVGQWPEYQETVKNF
mgnify:FL=1